MENLFTDTLKFVKLAKHVLAPERGSTYSVGVDLKSAYNYKIPPFGSVVIKTDIQVQLPKGTYGRIAPRSGLALRKIDVGGGVIDIDYSGNIGIILFNHGEENFSIAPGDRVAQLICEKIKYVNLEEVMILDDTDRGNNGFGSSGFN